jgi:hypothetical protein
MVSPKSEGNAKSTTTSYPIINFYKISNNKVKPVIYGTE